MIIYTIRNFALDKYRLLRDLIVTKELVTQHCFIVYNKQHLVSQYQLRLFAFVIKLKFFYKLTVKFLR